MGGGMHAHIMWLLQIYILCLISPAYTSVYVQQWPGQEEGQSELKELECWARAFSVGAPVFWNGIC